MPTSKDEVFAPAVQAHQAAGEPVSELGSFKDYCEKYGFDAQRTANYISVSHWGELAKVLKDNNTMVLRLGGPGPTRFALATVEDVQDFFVPEPGSIAIETYLPQMSLRSLFSYAVLGSISEQTLITLASTSGLMGHALGLDAEDSIEAPATGALTASFSFRAAPGADKLLKHVNGQVEIDAVFVGRRGGQDVLFVVEAKGKKPRLAKHKLVYPLLSLRQAQVPDDMEVVPVFFRAFRDGDKPRIIFEIAEGKFASNGYESPILTTLSFAPYRRFALPLPGF